ncbi:hypothetical protein FA13DRAFT_1806539 [Coprinellus micaceus]|uniref:Uncharacterized protein n=1 Tax=Coprinellus micaceus TaxID=71717 RepID=A0A4Y7RLD8_COPMI|nr:hypothetical protein FA13DRAFT_1806539 [Coprinellus micaceus]
MSTSEAPPSQTATTRNPSTPTSEYLPSSLSSIHHTHSARLVDNYDDIHGTNDYDNKHHKYHDHLRR